MDLLGSFAVEEVADEFLDTRDTGGAADKDDLVDGMPCRS